MNKAINNLICSIIFIVFGIALLFIVPAMTPAYKNDALGSRFFPNAIAVGMIIISGIQGSLAIISLKRCEDKEEYRIKFADNLRTVLFCLSAVLTVFLIDKVHFLLGAFIMTTSMLILCREKKISHYIIVYSCCIFAYLLFSQVLHVRI